MLLVGGQGHARVAIGVDEDDGAVGAALAVGLGHIPDLGSADEAATDGVVAVVEARDVAQGSLAVDTAARWLDMSVSRAYECTWVRT